MWPPPYTVRKNKRARRVGLKITREKGLEIVLPWGLFRANVDEILNEHRDWIEKTVKRLDLDLHTEPRLPEELYLRAIHEQWVIDPAEAHPEQLPLPLLGDNILSRPGDEPEKRQKMHKWLIKKGKDNLLPWLHQISILTGLEYSKGSIRGQSSRWGSCSPDKRISLNYKLLFLKPNLVRYVLIHELCHTIHLNHSQAFWSLVEQFDPDYKVHKRELNQVGEFIPI